MWRFKHFAHKEQSGLEGRTIDVGNLKVQVRNIIAEGGFSCVYAARDAIHGSKQYALKHMICNDEESLELVLKEISVMKSLKGHPNIIALCAHSIFDMGRTKEALICMEYCEKTLVSVLEGRGSGYYDEKQVLVIFRDVCNAVFAMHGQSPPIAHRDLKAENLLLGSDGLWKLCDFGSTSTNHKRFEKPEEMGIEEDNIRKHTTPAYRAPEMWDLYRKEMINEKVDIWALGCLLFRICYFKSAFDGESKLQILNGNYRIPELPKYSAAIVDLIRDMLQSSPDARPDITQVWFRVNNLLPDGLQKSLPDRAPNMPPPSPPQSGPIGAFWNTEHAKNEDLTGFDQNDERIFKDSGKGKEALEAEIEKLKLEKSEIASKYAKLSAICRSQRQEIQELKEILAAKNQTLSSPDESKPWEAFSEDSHQKRDASWGFGTDSFSATSQVSSSFNELNSSKMKGTQPAGWAGF